MVIWHSHIKCHGSWKLRRFPELNNVGFPVHYEYPSFAGKHNYIIHKWTIYQFSMSNNYIGHIPCVNVNSDSCDFWVKFTLRHRSDLEQTLRSHESENVDFGSLLHAWIFPPPKKTTPFWGRSFTIYNLQPKIGVGDILHSNPHTGVGKCPNLTSPNYWGYNLKQIFEGDVQIPKNRTFNNPCHIPWNLKFFHVSCFEVLSRNHHNSHPQPSTPTVLLSHHPLRPKGSPYSRASDHCTSTELGIAEESADLKKKTRRPPRTTLRVRQSEVENHDV